MKKWTALSIIITLQTNAFAGLYKGMYGSHEIASNGQPASTVGIDIADMNGDGIKTDTKRLATDGVRSLFYLPNRPVQRVLEVRVNGVKLDSQDANQDPNYCFNTSGGWISFRQKYTAAQTVDVDYTWSDAPDVVGANDLDQANFLQFKNNGGFTFTNDCPLTTYGAVTGAVHGIAVGDYNVKGGDGKPDVLLGNYSTGVAIWSKNAAGDYASITPEATARNTSHVAWGDIDSDGWQDYAIANGDGGTSNPSKLFLNKNGTSFQEIWANTSSKWSGFDFGDFNNDGALDFAVANNGNDKLEVWQNQRQDTGMIIAAIGGGSSCSFNTGVAHTFDPNTLDEQNGANSNIYMYRAAASDADNYYTVSWAGASSASARLLKTPHGSPTAYTSVVIPDVAGGHAVTATGVAVDDMYVYVLAGYPGNLYRLFKYTKNLVKVTGPIPVAGSYTISLEFDPTYTYMYTANTAGNKIIRIRASDLTTQSFAVSGQPHGVAADKDWIYYTTGDMWNNIRKTPADFSGIGEISTNISGGTAAQAICVVGDYIYVSNNVCGSASKLEKRNKSDLSYVTEVGANMFIETLSVGAVSTAPRKFTRVWQAPNVSTNKDVKWADMDNDGKLDLVVANEGEANIIYFNGGLDAGGNPIFTSTWQSPTVKVSRGVAIDDLNGDGKMDLVFANGGGLYSGAASVTLFLNQGSRNFTYAWGSDQDTAFNSFESRDIRIADMNKDGIPDIIASASYGDYNGIVVYSQDVMTGRKIIRIESKSTDKNGKTVTIIETYAVDDNNKIGRKLSTEVK